MNTSPNCYCRTALLIGLAASLPVLFPATKAHAETDETLFQKLDTNEDGVLSGKEARSVLAFDLDQDGEVTQKEFLQGMAAERKRMLSIDDDTLFNQQDGNQDDFLSGKEVRGFE